MGWTTPKTWGSSTLGSAELNEQIRDNETWLKAALATQGITSDSAINKVKSARCGVSLGNSGDLSAATATDKTLSWDTEDYDTDAFHSTSSNTARITIPSGLDGTYLLLVDLVFQSNSSGDRWLWIENSSGTKVAQTIQRAAANTATDAQVTAIVSAAAGEWYAAHAYQDSGSTLTLSQSLTRSCFRAVRLFAA